MEQNSPVVAEKSSPWMNFKEATRYLKVSRGFLQGLRRAGKLPAYTVGIEVRFLIKDLDQVFQKETK